MNAVASAVSAAITLPHQLAMIERSFRLQRYVRLRAYRPDLPAYQVFAFVREDHDQSLEHFLCERYVGHDWRYTGTQYGGDDERWHGEGRAYCANCGADGDA